jgi:hypothetical protein
MKPPPITLRDIFVPQAEGTESATEKLSLERLDALLTDAPVISLQSRCRRSGQ